MRPLQGYTARVVFAKVLIQDGLERKTFATNMTVKGLVACMLADVILQLIFPGVLLATHATDKRCDPHVQAHVPVQAPLLVEGFGAVDAGETGVVPEPPLGYLLLSEVLHVAAYSHHCGLFYLCQASKTSTRQHRRLSRHGKGKQIYFYLCYEAICLCVVANETGN